MGYNNRTRQQLEDDLDGKAAPWTTEALVKFYTQHYQNYLEYAASKRLDDPDYADQLLGMANYYKQRLDELAVSAPLSVSTQPGA